ncbi:MAG: hypothetical protein QQN62_05960, partial [Nitrosopumilus sp.]
MSDSKNTSSSQQETVTKEDPKKITELEAKLAKKDQEIQEIKQKKSESEIVTNLPARIIKQNTFGNNFHNGYADGTVKKATKELRATQRKAS